MLVESLFIAALIDFRLMLCMVLFGVLYVVFFLGCNLVEEERAGCFTLIGLLMSC